MAALRPRTLRARLLAALVGLVAVVCLVIGGVTAVAMHEYLLGQLDTRLQAAGGRSATAAQRPDDHSRPPAPPGDSGRSDLGFLTAPGQAAGTVGARVDGGQVADAGVLDESGTLRSIPASAQSTLAALPADGKPHTRDLGSLGAYRLLAATTPDGDVIVTGLPLNGLQTTLYQLAAVEAGVAVLALIVAGFAGALIVRLTLRPLRRVAATAGRVAELPLDQGEVDLPERVPAADTDPRTEVGQVGSAFNRMLGHVSAALRARHASETQVRQFVADASHELRTPLAVIRGYAEVTRRSATSVPPDVVHALGRIESAAARMTVLVEDMLLLARLDAGRPLAHDLVDLSRLLVDAVGDAHAAGPDHRWVLDLGEDPVVVVGDADRLHQVVANLMVNARVHTPAGTTVTASLRGHDGDAVLSIMDDGPGIPAELLPQVFIRFARGDDARSHAAGSTGLGLSIVDAVVCAHGGTVEAQSRPGQTTFAVTLPVSPGRDATDERPAAIVGPVPRPVSSPPARVPAEPAEQADQGAREDVPAGR